MNDYRNPITILVLVGVIGILAGCGGSPAERQTTSSNGEALVAPSGYDPALADKLGADDHGMKQYVFAFLKSGPTRSQTDEEAERLQRAHLDNINRLAEEGKLVLAGPFLDEGELRGIYVFDVRTVEEARALTETDPSIKAGRLVMELRPWYGSAALGMLNDWHHVVSKEKI